ncbi:MAG: YjfB family protein [Lachnospiraceae bacterium]|nr:YjfB family protein [Lachnospiraceae bacterium]MBR0148525.1 YjfB family protein [Lachnospiraceae bacterium]MBR4174418.1 YjfB family protein [Lachnospiraceae bacterium]
MDVTSLAMPDIASLSMVMAQDKVMSDFGTAMLSKSLDTFEQNGAEMAKMLELSVNPGVGGNFDMSV